MKAGDESAADEADTESFVWHEADSATAGLCSRSGRFYVSVISESGRFENLRLLAHVGA
jgi:hypothetical protein